MAESKEDKSTLQARNPQPGAVDWTPHIWKHRLSGYEHNGAIFDGHFSLGDAFYNNYAALDEDSRRPPSARLAAEAPDLPPSLPYHAQADMRLYPYHDRSYPRKGLTDEMPDAFFGAAAADGPQRINMNYDTEMRLKTCIWGDPNGAIARRVVEVDTSHAAHHAEYDRDRGRHEKADAAQRARVEKNPHYARLPRLIDETYVGGKRRHLVVHSQMPGRSVEKFFDAQGRLHRVGAPAVVERRPDGMVEEWREHGEPHCLTGPWRRGREEAPVTEKKSFFNQGQKIFPAYAIRGKEMSREEFYAHPEVIAARGGVMERLGRFMESFGDDGGGGDSRAEIEAMRRQDRVLQIRVLLQNEPRAVQSAVLGRIAGMATGVPGAQELADCRARDIAALVRGEDAARNLDGAVDKVDGALRDIATLRDEMKSLPGAQDALDGLIGEMVERKNDTAAIRATAREALKLEEIETRSAEVFAQAGGILRDGALPMPAGAESAEILQGLAKYHATLSDPAAPARAWQAAADDLETRAQKLVEEVPQRLQKVRDDVMKAVNYLDSKYAQGESFSRWIGTPAPPADTGAKPQAGKPRM